MLLQHGHPETAWRKRPPGTEGSWDK